MVVDQSAEQQFIRNYLGDTRVCVVWGNTPTPNNTYICVGNPDNVARLPINMALKVLGLGDEVLAEIFEAEEPSNKSSAGNFKKNAMQIVSNLLRREVVSFYEDKQRKVRIPKGWFKPRVQLVSV